MRGIQTLNVNSYHPTFDAEVGCGGGENQSWHPSEKIIKLNIERNEPLLIDGIEDTLSFPECCLLACEFYLKDMVGHPSTCNFDTTSKELCSRIEDMRFEIVERNRCSDEEHIHTEK